MGAATPGLSIHRTTESRLESAEVDTAQLDTPALTVDLDVLEKNIRDVQEDCDRIGIALRAHTKTHKTPRIAEMQVRAGARGIVCQKLGEAEAMAAAGLDDILIPYNLVGASKLERLGRLIKAGKTITVAADSEAVVDGLSAMASSMGCTVRVVVEMDCGGHRTGVPTPEGTVDLAERIDSFRGLDFMGVIYYKGSDAPEFIAAVRSLAGKAGLPLHIVGGGGTGAQERSKAAGCTEVRMGSYAYEGMTRVGQDTLSPDRCPLRVIVTVVSVRPGEAIVDAGQKAFTSDPPTPYGLCIEHPEIRLSRMSVEHGILDVSESARQFRVGDVLSIIPLHGGKTTNLYDRMHAVKEREVVETWEIAGRGKFQ